MFVENVKRNDLEALWAGSTSTASKLVKQH